MGLLDSDVLTREDLTRRGKYTYTWTHSPGDNPNITGKPDSGRVSRKEGYEMLDYINSFAKKHGIWDKSVAFQIEDYIHAGTEIMRDRLTRWLELHARHLIS